MNFLILLITTALVVYCGASPISPNFSTGYLQFSADVYKQLAKSNSGNFLVCPISVETALALAHTGANGPTAKQITSTLHLPEDKKSIQKIFSDLTPRLKGNEDYELSNANKIYVKNNFKINQDFKEVAVNVFQSEIENIDFEADSQAATKINQWVEEKTQNKIKDLINKGDLNEDTRLVLLNALYFHGKWVTPFEEKNTRRKPFHVDAKKDTELDMMEITHTFNYSESSKLKAKFLEMPYKGEDLTMTFVLPNGEEGLANLEENIAEVLKTPEYKRERVHVQIPKFKVESKIQFKEVLQKLGIVQAFTDTADFTGIAGQLLKISKIVQKTFMEVKEQGTEAAAATAVLVEIIRASVPFDFPLLQFNANHPFIFYLKSPAGILFVGRYIGG